MKLLILNEKEKKELTKLLSEQVRKGCKYSVITVLEKLSIAEYERAFGIMDAGRHEPIRRCPFCGERPIIKKEPCGDTFYYFIKCENCKAEINNPKFNEEEAKDDWNRRTLISLDVMK